MEMHIIESTQGGRLRVRPEDIQPHHKAITPATKTTAVAPTPAKPKTKKAEAIEVVDADADIAE